MVQHQKHIKCVVIGDDCVGKTSMLVTYATNRFPTTFVPSAFDNYAGLISLSGKKRHLQLLDTLEQEALNDTTRSIFSEADVFVVCYSAVQPKSFKNVQEKWVPKIRNLMGDMPLVLVATQTDLRENNKTVKYVSRAEGLALAKRVGCACYIECSPEKDKKVKRRINKAISSVLIQQEMQLCSIL